MSLAAALDRGLDLARQQQLADIRRMKLVAGGLLALVFLLFIVTSILEGRWPWLAYPRAFAEAAMVGACADWFAIVALFRHPFGLPIPHTAIVPNHQVEIGQALGRFASNNFLAPDEVTQRLGAIDASAWIVRWLKNEDNIKGLVRHSRGLLPRAASFLGDDKIRGYSGQLIRKAIDSVALAPVIARTLSVAVAEGYHATAYDKALDLADSYLDAHGDAIRQRIARGSNRWVPGWVDSKLGDAFLGELAQTLKAAHAPDHPWRSAFLAQANRLIIQLAEDPETYEACERVKSAVLDASVVDGYLGWLEQEIDEKLKAEIDAPEGRLVGAIETALTGLGHWLETDAELYRTLNHWVHEIILAAIVPNRADIGGFVADVVARWDTETLVAKFEAQVGKDLQYIRVNGTLVGGLVGLLIFTLSRLLGAGAL